VLTPFQEDFLRLFSKTVLAEHFFLTGGTALSALKPVSIEELKEFFEAKSKWLMKP
jgi:hypothetical protein